MTSIVDARQDARARLYRRSHLGRWLGGAVVLALVCSIAWTMSQARIAWPQVLQFMTYDVMIQGAINTILLAVAAQVSAIVIGVIVAVMRISHNPVANWVAVAYIWIFRGVPVLVQILLWYNLALVTDRITISIPFTRLVLFDEATNVVMSAFVASLLGLALNESAYMAEIIRAGIKGIDPGQAEAAGALGMTPMRTLYRIVLPQAMRIIIPPTGNNFINMLKTTSLASTVTYLELLKAANNIASRNLAIMESLFTTSIWYMVIVSLASVLQYYVERRFDASTVRESKRGLRASVRRQLTTPPTVRKQP
ncbi:MAG: amino acid ABC transporter permease [Propionicimonas sp.]